MIALMSVGDIPAPVPAVDVVALDGWKNCMPFSDQSLFPKAVVGEDTCMLLAGILADPRDDDIVGTLIEDSVVGKENALADTIISAAMIRAIVRTDTFLTLPPSTQYVV